MALKWAKKLLLAKAESTAGTAEALTKADAILVSNVELNQLAGDSVSRELERSYFGNSDQIPVNTHLSLTFRVELAGSGAKKTPPGWGKLLLPCGMKETVGSMTVDYAPISENEPTLTLGLNIDGQLHTLAGSRGSFGIESGANAIPYLTFSFTGLYTEPSSVAATKMPVFTAFKKPLVGSNKNTPAFSFHGKGDLALSGFNYDHANEVVHREVIGAANSVVISNRAPTGSVTIDTPKYTDLNLVARAKAGTLGALVLQHGTADGEKVAISLPQTAISGISNTEADGIWQNEVSFAVLPKDGNDEIKITTS